MFKNLEIKFYMNSPIVAIDYLHLDSILAAAIMKEKIGEEYYDYKPNESQLIDIDLPLDKKYGVWCSSIGFGNNKESIGSWCKRWENKYDDCVKFNGKKERVDIGSGYFKSYHIPLVIKSYDYVIFYVRGDKEEISRLLNTYINYIGKKSSQGYGEIREIIINEIKEDWSCFKDNKPMRPIPIREYPNYLKDLINKGIEFTIQTGLYSIKTPYWRTDCLEKCYIPI